MKILNKILLACLFSGLPFFVIAQQKDSSIIPGIFLNYIQAKIPLTAQELVQMRPLAIKYFNETRQIQKQYDDPLIRNQARATLKLQYRNLFIPIIGARRANQFFTEEQLFRKRIKEELKQRRESARG